MEPLRRPTLCVIAGPNGSGKTTTTEQLLANEWGADSLYINPDNIAQEGISTLFEYNEVLMRDKHENLKYNLDYWHRDSTEQEIF